MASDAGRAFVVIVRDVTERKAVERMKDEFVATVSHELRTPLTALRGHVELVLDGDGGPVTELQQRFLQVATQSADRLGALINDLLDVAKIEAGRVQLRKELVDLGGVLREVSATFRIEATRHGLAFREDLGELPPVVGDRDRLIQVFGNLVSNAIKYTRAGEVGVSARPIYGAVEVVVHDTGIGMTPDEQRQLFTKFFRSRDRAGPDPGGTGLGLVIAKGIVEGHGGTLPWRASPAWAPASASRSRPSAASPERARSSGSEAATVLVVDDEVTIRDLLLEYLQMWDYGAVPAASGAEALELARRIKPDLIILDVGMLPMSGLDVLRQLKKDPATRPIPVLLHSVTDEPEQMLALGATDFLRKPVSGARLREAILRALDQTPVPLFVLDGDDARRERIRTSPRGDGARREPRPDAGRGGGDPPDAAADHRARPAPRRRGRRPAGRPMERRPGVPRRRRWSWWARGRPRPPRPGPGCHVEILRGQRAADAAGRVRALIARRRGARAARQRMARILLAEDEQQIGDMVAFKLANAGSRRRPRRRRRGGAGRRRAGAPRRHHPRRDDAAPGRVRVLGRLQGRPRSPRDPGDHAHRPRPGAGRAVGAPGRRGRLHREALQPEGAARARGRRPPAPLTGHSPRRRVSRRRETSPAGPALLDTDRTVW